MSSKSGRHLGLALVAIASSLLIAGPADAVIGRPLTPLSYAGVARRTTRRAVVAGAAVAPAVVAPAPVVVAPPPVVVAPPPVAVAPPPGAPAAYW